MGLSPLPVPPHVFAVEPGGLAYGRFERRGPGFELAAWGEVELAADSFQEGLLGGPVREPRRLSEAWIPAAGDGSAEFRLAFALAGLRMARGKAAR